MAQNLAELWKRGTTSPLAADLEEGGLAIDVQNKKAYSKANDGTVFPLGGGSGAWGGITGDIADQTDLQTELNARVSNDDGVHTPVMTLVSLTQGQYDAIVGRGADTLYIIVG